MPMASAAILVSSATLIGTSTNLLVSWVMTQFGVPPIGMFELTSIGIPKLMLFIGQRLIPIRTTEEPLTDKYNLRPFLAKLSIVPGSTLDGSTHEESHIGQDFDLVVWR
jgi:di/tricarboxylate transporter